MSNLKTYISQSLVELIESGGADEACEIIDEIISTEVPEEGVCGDIINILLLIPDYKRAKNIFVLYFEKTGKNLVCDITLDEISKEEDREVRVLEAGKWKAFERMSVLERGHFSNKIYLNPVINLNISEEGVCLKKRFSKWRKYKWNLVSKAFIENDQAYKSYGAGTGGRYQRSTLHILTIDSEYLIDVSSNFPDFRNSKKLLSELRKYLFVQEL